MQLETQISQVIEVLEQFKEFIRQAYASKSYVLIILPAASPVIHSLIHSFIHSFPCYAVTSRSAPRSCCASRRYNRSLQYDMMAGWMAVEPLFRFSHVFAFIFIRIMQATMAVLVTVETRRIVRADMIELQLVVRPNSPNSSTANALLLCQNSGRGTDYHETDDNMLLFDEAIDEYDAHTMWARDFRSSCVLIIPRARTLVQIGGPASSRGRSLEPRDARVHADVTGALRRQLPACLLDDVPSVYDTDAATANADPTLPRLQPPVGGRWHEDQDASHRHPQVLDPGTVQ
mgnify:CR=1 FL=1